MMIQKFKTKRYYSILIIFIILLIALNYLSNFFRQELFKRNNHASNAWEQYLKNHFYGEEIPKSMSKELISMNKEIYESIYNLYPDEQSFYNIFSTIALSVILFSLIYIKQSRSKIILILTIISSIIFCIFYIQNDTIYDRNNIEFIILLPLIPLIIDLVLIGIKTDITNITTEDIDNKLE